MEQHPHVKKHLVSIIRLWIALFPLLTFPKKKSFSSKMYFFIYYNLYLIKTEVLIADFYLPITNIYPVQQYIIMLKSARSTIPSILISASWWVVFQ